MSKQTSSADDSSLNIAFFSVLTVSIFLLFMFTEGEAVPREGEEKVAVLSSLADEIKDYSEEEEDVTLYSENSILARSAPTYHKPEVRGTIKEEEKEEKKDYEQRWVSVSAYAPLDANAVPGMCFSGDPSVTASGSTAREGIVAANFLSFGTKIRIPSLFGDRVLIVEDRMSSRYNNTVDVLVSSQQEAINFGKKNTYIEILN